MDFLTLDDLRTHAFDQFINESSADFIRARDESERQNISLIKSKINQRYDVADIFSKSGENRHPLIVRVLTFLVQHDIISRNSARKVPEDFKERYKWAMKWLDDVRDRHETPEGLPELTDEDGNPLRGAIWGNNSNENYYL